MELRDVLFGVAAVLLEQGDDVVKLGARMRLEQLLEVSVNRAPRLRLLLRVLDARNRGATKITFKLKSAFIVRRRESNFEAFVFISKELEKFWGCN